MDPKHRWALVFLGVLIGCARQDPERPEHALTCGDRLVGGVWQSEVGTRLPADAPPQAGLSEAILLIHSVQLEFSPAYVYVSSRRTPRSTSRPYRVTANTSLECDVTVDPDGGEPIPYHVRFVDDDRAFVRVNIPDNPLALQEEAWVRQRR